MVAELWWYVQGRILYSPGSTLKEDIMQRNAMALELIETEGQPPLVHTLIDHTQRYSAEDLQAMPRQVQYYMFSDGDEVREKLIRHPMLGWVLSISTPTTALKMAGSVISQQDNYRWRNFDTLDEALDFLEQTDSTLGKLPRPEKM